MKKSALIVVDPQPSFTQYGKYSIIPHAMSVYRNILKISKFFDVLVVTSKSMKDDEDFKNDIDKGILTKSNGKVNCGFFVKNVDSDNIFSSGYSEELERFLNINNIERVFLTGPIGDKNVKETAIDCSKEFDTYFLVDCVRYSDNIKNTIDILIDNNINILNSDDISIFR